MYLAATRLGLPVVDWIQEYDAFPLFGKVGGMPFPKDDPTRRGVTTRKTIRLLRSGERNLILFAEGVLHRPPTLLPFGRSLELIAKRVPSVQIVPTAIIYQHSLHERPEAFLAFGKPVEHGPELPRRTRLEVSALLDRTKAQIAMEEATFELLAPGVKDVNERMDWRNSPLALRKRR
jgi:1-acyl-sn-glycerol-3-phosphate acyltransferase